MAGLLGVHEVELRPGADSAEFERLAAWQAAPHLSTYICSCVS